MARTVRAPRRPGSLVEVKLFEFTDRNLTREADPDPAVLAHVDLGWRVLVGRDRRPIGVRLTLERTGPEDGAPPLSGLLDGVLEGLQLESEGQPVFPHGMILLSPRNLQADAALSGWRAPRNVLLEFAQSDLDGESRLRQLFDVQKEGVRIALRVDQPQLLPSERLQYFPYLVAASRRSLPAAIDSGASILTLEDATHARIEEEFAAGVHATAGWPLAAMPRSEPQGLSPAQTAVFELIRLVQADAPVRDLERVFKGEPLLAYLLLTLANSTAFRRPTPVSSLGHAISLLGYQRLIKWLVLLLAIAGKHPGTAPLVYVAVVRGHLLENLTTAAGRPRGEGDDAFIVGTFSLLEAITGQPLGELLRDVHLPGPITDALVGATGRYAPLLEIAHGLESCDPRVPMLARAELNIDAAEVNRALLRALTMADSMQSLLS